MEKVNESRPPAGAVARGVFPAPAGAGDGPQMPSAAGGRVDTADVPVRESPASRWAAAGIGEREGASCWWCLCRDVPTRNCPRGVLALGRWPVPQDPPGCSSRVAATTGGGPPILSPKVVLRTFSLASPRTSAGVLSWGRPPSGATNEAGRVALPGTPIPCPQLFSAAPEPVPPAQLYLGGPSDLLFPTPGLAAPPDEGPTGYHRASLRTGHSQARRAAEALVLRVPLGLEKGCVLSLARRTPQ